MKPSVELGRDVHRLLPGHRVGDEKDLVGRDRGHDLLQLPHHLIIDVKATGGVEDDHVVQVLLGPLPRLGRDLRWGEARERCDRDLQALPQRHQLVDRRRTIDVGGDEPGGMAGLAEEEPKLGRGRRLPRALQSDEHDHRRTVVQVESDPLGPHQFGEGVAHDLNQLLGRGEALQHLLPDRTGADLPDQILDHLVVDVGLEQREPDLAQPGIHVLLRQLPLSAQAGEDPAQPLGQRIEHLTLLDTSPANVGHNARHYRVNPSTHSVNRFPPRSEIRSRSSPRGTRDGR